MYIIASDCIVNMDQVQFCHRSNGQLTFEIEDGSILFDESPDDSLQQIATGLSQGLPYIEMDLRLE